MDFTSLELPEPVRQGIREAGFVTATPIQEAALPLGQPARTLLGEVEQASRRFLPRLGACLYRVQRIPTIPVSAGEWRRIWSASRARRAPAPA